MLDEAVMSKLGFSKAAEMSQLVLQQESASEGHEKSTKKKGGLLSSIMGRF